MKSRQGTRLRFEPLEDRHLLAAQLLADINTATGPLGSRPTNLFEFDGDLYFVAENEFGRELWMTDGTENGTSLVENFGPGGLSSAPRDFVEHNGRLYFTADGDPEDHPRYSPFSGEFDNFSAITMHYEYDGLNALPLPQQDFGAQAVSTPAGLLYRIADREQYNFVDRITMGFTGDLERSLAFQGQAVSDFVSAGNDVYYHYGPFEFDPQFDSVARFDVVTNEFVPMTLAGDTEELPRRFWHDVVDLLWFDNALHFVRAPSGQSIFNVEDVPPVAETELWRWDGLDEPVKVAAVDIGPDEVFDEVNGLLFTAAVDSMGKEPWISDGTEAGTVRLRDINPGPDSSHPNSFVAFEDQTLFLADDGEHGQELWITDHTEGGTRMLKDLREGPVGSDISNIVVMGEYVYFAADDGFRGSELWRSDGTAVGTELVADMNGVGSSSPDWITEFDGKLFFSANDGIHGHEMWVADGSIGDAQLLFDVFFRRLLMRCHVARSHLGTLSYSPPTIQCMARSFGALMGHPQARHWLKIYSQVRDRRILEISYWPTTEFISSRMTESMDQSCGSPTVARLGRKWSRTYGRGGLGLTQSNSRVSDRGSISSLNWRMVLDCGRPTVKLRR